MNKHSSLTVSKQTLVPHFPIPPHPPTSPRDLRMQAVSGTLFAPAAVNAVRQTQALVKALAVAQAIELPIEVGATAIPNRATFEQLASRDDVPGALGVREVKFWL